MTITAGAGGNVGGRHEPVRAGEQPRPPRRLERLVREGADGPRAARLQVGGEAEHRPQRVGVGVHVAREDDVGCGPEHRGGAAELLTHRASSWCEPLDQIRSTRSPLAIVSSSSNRSSGVTFRRTCRPSSRRRCGVAL